MSYPFYTPYQFASNSPILNIDLDGLEAESTQPGTSGNKSEDLRTRTEKMLRDLDKAIERNRKEIKQAETLLKQLDAIEVRANTMFQKNLANKAKIDALKSDFEKGGQTYENFKALDEIWKNMSYEAPVLEGIQSGLDLAGAAPVIGEAADGINGLGYLFQGKFKDAGISFAGMIPLLGNLATAERLAKLKGAGVLFKCTDYALDFSKKFAKSLSAAGYAVTKFTLKAGSDFGIMYKGEVLTSNSIHVFTEVSKDGKKFIFDNMNPAGIPYEDFIKNLEVVKPGGGVAVGEEAYKLATKE